MKAIVLAGGHATRLWPLTRNRAKPLLPLGGKPIIWYILDELGDVPAIDEVLISTNAKYAPDFESFLEEHGYDHVRVVVEEHQREEEKVGSLGAIIEVMEQEGRDDYVVVGGDNYTTFSLADFVAYAKQTGSVVNACYELDRVEDATQFGVVETDAEGRITAFVEKPDDPPSRLVSTAFYYFPAAASELFEAYITAHEGTDTDYLDEPGRLIEWGHERYDMYAYAFTGGWYDIGTPEKYLAAQAALGDGVQHGEVIDCEVGANVWVLDGAVVEDAVLENCIVFPDAHIRQATVRNSIVDEKATVDGTDLEDAVIGAHSRVQ